MNIKFHNSLLFAACMVISSISAAEVESSDSTIKSTAKAAVSSVITAGKNLLGGVSEGVVDGRQTVQGADGAEIISSLAQMKDRITVELLKVELRADGSVVTLGFKNGTDGQLRLINLKKAGVLLAIDQGGYANNLTVSSDNSDEITVPPKAAIRHRFRFESTDEMISAVRLWGQEYQNHKL